MTISRFVPCQPGSQLSWSRYILPPTTHANLEIDASTVIHPTSLALKDTTSLALKDAAFYTHSTQILKEEKDKDDEFIMNHE